MRQNTWVKDRQLNRRASLPTGTVTFLFTDIEGSAERWDRARPAMQEAVRLHDRLMREAIATHQGHVFKTIGDAFCVAFAIPESALHAAISAQRAIAAEDFTAVGGLRVRMAIDVGTADERDGDYFGPTVNRVARLVSVGHGGQILVSSATHELVQNEVPNEFEFIDLGSHRLKDLSRPEQVWQVLADGLPSEFSRLNTLDKLPNNLPFQVTTFRGREQDLEDLKQHIAEHRLVTLSGAGGVGKTRLAVQLGAEVLDRFADGVWIADFAPSSDSELIPSMVAKALGVSQAQMGRVAEQILEFLKQKHLLLIFDNCEHVLEAAAALVDAIHCSCPNVVILASSRQALGLRGEKVLRVASLAVPEGSANPQAAAALSFGAVALFVDRASLVDQSFRLDDHNSRIVSEICRRLDGIPLAIELAAARVNVMSLASLSARLNERFEILTGGSRTALPRQKTLSALFDWSYELLTPDERVLFNRVAIFPASFTLDAAARACAAEGAGPGTVLDLVTSLTDKSLIVADTRGDRERYRLLESTREYALAKLTASGERERLARSHAEYFLLAAQTAQNSFEKMRLSEWLSGLEPEMENLRAAIDWALDRDQDVALGGSIAAALVMFWWHGGWSAQVEGLHWIQAALSKIDPGDDAELTAGLRRALGLLSSRILYS